MVLMNCVWHVITAAITVQDRQLVSLVIALNIEVYLTVNAYACSITTTISHMPYANHVTIVVRLATTEPLV
jgi:hypothetical protein